MRFQNLNRLLWSLSACAMAFAPLAASALEDIDLYAGGGSASPPNVLFYLDNSSNWSANNNAWSYDTVYAKCTTNYSGNATKLQTCQQNVNYVFCGTTTACSGNPNLRQGQVELRALQMVLRATYCDATGAKKLNYNVGVMMGARSTNAGSVDSASVGTSYIRHAIRPMSDDQCLSSAPSGGDLTKYLMADLSNIDSKINDEDFKTSSSFEYGAGFYEAFKYFGGWTNPSKAPGTAGGGAAGIAGSPTDSTHFGPIRYSNVNTYEDSDAFTDATKGTYKSPISSYGSCGNNYIVLIGNTFPNQEYGTDQNANPPTNTVMSRLSYSPSQLYSVSNKSKTRFGDEWVKFLYDTDVSDASGQQNVRTFAIDVFNAATDADQSALLQSMAKAGQNTTDYKAGYFSVGGDIQALIDALTDILTEIAGINSVFASAALPVSVNAQGTYLNQIFIGMFRPDEQAQQRWYGNLKQYKFGLNSDGSMYLSDSGSASAVDSSNTGFIKNCATSTWTSDSARYWEKITGTESACATQTTSVYSDSPDGPMVERGGAAQKLRNLGYASRNLRTCSSPSSCSTLTNFTSGSLSSTAINNASGTALSSSEKQTLAEWVMGKNVGDGTWSASGVSYNSYTTANSLGVALDANSTRPTVHGDVVHSTPLAVNYGSAGGNDVVVFYGAGDGTLRAVDGNTTGITAGQELWAFIAPEHYAKLERVRSNSPLISYQSVSSTLSPTPTPKSYFFDGPITGYQDANPLTKLALYVTMRRGGNMVYAFDASRKPGSASGSQPTIMWRFGCASDGTGCATGASGEAQMGQSWSPVTVIKVKGLTDPLVVFGGGYHSCEDSETPNTACASTSIGQGIYVMNALTGTATNHKYIAPAAGSYTTSAGSLSITPGRFVAGVTPVDVNGDGYVDLLYAVDTRGNVWRINTSDPAANYAGYAGGVDGWPAPKLIGVVSEWTGGDSEKRKFMYAANAIVISNTQVLVLAGTGDREKPSSSSSASAVKNRFYGIKDTFATSSPTAAIGYGNVSVGTNLTDLMNVTGRTSVDLTALATMKGWFMDLYTTTVPYEQVVTTPLTLGGITFFNTYQAKAQADASTCSNLGTARGYQIDFLTGVMQENSAGDRSPSTYLSQGIPTSPVGGRVDIDGTTKWFCISCGKTPTILDPGSVAITPNTQRKQVYRYQKSRDR